MAMAATPPASEPRTSPVLMLVSAGAVVDGLGSPVLVPVPVNGGSSEPEVVVKVELESVLVVDVPVGGNSVVNCAACRKRSRLDRKQNLIHTRTLSVVDVVEGMVTIVEVLVVVTEVSDCVEVAVVVSAVVVVVSSSSPLVSIAQDGIVRRTCSICLIFTRNVIAGVEGLRSLRCASLSNNTTMEVNVARF